MRPNSPSGPNFVFRKVCRSLETPAAFMNAEDFRLRVEFLLQDEFRLRGRMSSSGPKLVFRAEFRLQDRISSSGPNSVFGAEFRLQGRISSSRPNFVFSAPKTEFRLQGRFSSSNIVFAHNLSFSSWRTISSSKASEFRLQGGDETGTQFPGSM